MAVNCLEGGFARYTLTVEPCTAFLAHTCESRTFEDNTGSRCQFVTEAGAAPVVTSYSSFAPSAKCDSVLASSRFEKSGKVYYLAMLRTDDKKQMVGVPSVAPDGHIAVEKTLSESINSSGMTNDMKMAKAALIKKIQ